MPSAVPSTTLHVQPNALPAVRAAVEEGLTDLQVQLMKLTNGAFIPEPWMGDPISEDVRVFYNTTVMESANGSLSALLAYQTELTRIRDSLQVMESQYLSNENQVAGDMRRQQA